MEKWIKTSSFGHVNKLLSIKDGVLSLDSKSISLQSVTGFRYGVVGLRFDMFPVGRKYEINLKNNDTEVRVGLRSYFGNAKAYFLEIYNSIFEAIWDDTAVRLINNAIEDLLHGKSFQIGNCMISAKGIILNTFLIDWADLNYQKNYDKLTINSKSNHKIWTNLYYLETYNTHVMMSVLDWIFKHGGLREPLLL